jgi:drug/metabolite transporter (DMT)-like permease
VAVIGAAVATGVDIGRTGTAVVGDLLALAGGVAAAVYTAFGERARSTISTTGYTAVCYLVCSLLLLVICLAARQPLTGYPATAWLALVGLTVGAQLLGHSLLSFALRRVVATTVSVVVLLEVPGAAVLGWLWLGQVPRPGSIGGLALLLVGVALVIVAGRSGRAGDLQPEAGVIAPDIGTPDALPAAVVPRVTSPAGVAAAAGVTSPVVDRPPSG